MLVRDRSTGQIVSHVNIVRHGQKRVITFSTWVGYYQMMRGNGWDQVVDYTASSLAAMGSVEGTTFAIRNDGDVT